MLTVNGKKFARNNSEFTDSLFQSGGTCSGYYKPIGNGVLFMDHQRVPFAFLTPNGGGFFVTATRQADGRIRYMFALCPDGEKRLGIAGLRYAQERDIAADVLKQWRGVVR